MSWFGLSPTALLIGAAVLAAVAVALHLLRVRLRHVEVDTLLFFRLAGTVRQPRSLPGSPSRWLSLLLLLLALASAWTALGDPRSGQDAASRMVVVEPAGGESSVTAGAVVSVRVYCHVAPAPDGSNGLDGLSKSPMAFAPFHPT